MSEGWLPAGPLRVGVTAGASTPNSEIGESIARLLTFRGVPAEELEALARAGSGAAEKRRTQGKSGADRAAAAGTSDAPPGERPAR